MRTIGFFGKVFGAAVAVISITAVGVYTAALPSLERAFEEEAERRVAQEAAWAAGLCRAAYDPASDEFRLSVAGESLELLQGLRLTIVRPDGTVELDNRGTPELMDDHLLRPEIRAPGHAVTRYSRTLAQEMTYYALPVSLDGELRGYVRVALPVADREARRAALQTAVREGALVAVLVSLVLAWFFANRVTKPMNEIATLVTEIGTTQTRRRLSVRGDDEVGRLAAAVNRMADDLQKQVSRIERDRAEREAIFSALAAGLLAVDEDQAVLFVNQQARALLGDLEGRLKGQHVWELTRNAALLEVIEDCLARKARIRGEMHAQLGEGEAVVEITAVPLGGEESAHRGCVLELRDVSELRRLESVRTDFVTNVSHELKTPLTAMRGYLEAVLEDAEMPAELRRSFLEKAHKNTERLVAIVVDLLALSRLESQGHELEFEEVELEDLATSVLDDLQDLADSRKTRLVLEAREPGLRVVANEQAIGMALSNLVGNAIRYSPEGREVRVVLEALGAKARIDVVDQGPGIPPQERERIFERFYRLDKARSRRLGGTGLGLAIVRHVMSAHGGKVELESEPGRGSRFRLVLDRA